MTTNLTVFDTMIRLVVAMILGGIIGFERRKGGKPAGIKTNALVCLGSCLVMITSVRVYQLNGGNGDLTRMGAQVVSGIGFLGAGMIIVTPGNRVKGLTSAASIWFAACLGLAIGVGFYLAALVSTVLMFIIIYGLSSLDAFFKSTSPIVLVILENPDDLADFITLAHHLECKIIEIDRDQHQLLIKVAIDEQSDAKEVKTLLNSFNRR